jgi:transposase
MTKAKKYQRYSPEFKREALKRAIVDGTTDKQICEELGISSRQLRRWRDELRLLGTDAFPNRGQPRDDEVIRLKRELSKAKQERDFLKHAVVFFAKESE